jgi:hypothetical protein
MADSCCREQNENHGRRRCLERQLQWLTRRSRKHDETMGQYQDVEGREQPGYPRAKETRAGEDKRRDRYDAEADERHHHGPALFQDTHAPECERQDEQCQ